MLNMCLRRFLMVKIYEAGEVYFDGKAPVPSYYGFVQQRDFVKDHQKVLIENMNLKRKLEIATKALKEIAFEIGDLASDYGYHYELAEKALKEMEGVK